MTMKLSLEPKFIQKSPPKLGSGRELILAYLVVLRSVAAVAKLLRIAPILIQKCHLGQYGMKKPRNLQLKSNQSKRHLMMLMWR